MAGMERDRGSWSRSEVLDGIGSPLGWAGLPLSRGSASGADRGHDGHQTAADPADGSSFDARTARHGGPSQALRFRASDPILDLVLGDISGEHLRHLLVRRPGVDPSTLKRASDASHGARHPPCVMLRRTSV